MGSLFFSTIFFGFVMFWCIFVFVQMFRDEKIKSIRLPYRVRKQTGQVEYVLFDR